jgi:hypothetical protein
MDFRLLGPLEVDGEDGPADVGAGKRRALLTYLLINPNEVVPTERLIDELWSEPPPATAAKSVQVYVSQLRKALQANGDLLVTRGSGYVLRVGDDELDIQRFEHLLTKAQRLLEDGDAKPLERLRVPRSIFGAGRRSTTWPTSRLRRPKRRGSTSFGSSRSRPGSTQTSCSASTPAWPGSSRRWSQSTRCANASVLS